jgi:hypothetical protein
MKFLILVALCAAGTLAAPNTVNQRPQASKPQSSPQQNNVQASGDELPLAETCDPKKCFAPNCRCASVTLDEKIPVDKTPQVAKELSFVVEF